MGTQATNRGKSCTSQDLAQNECSIPIRHLNLRNTGTTLKWKEGDTRIDWAGPESGQAQGAEGTALEWTTNDGGSSASVAINGYGYEPLNTWGEHYWMLDIEMDCSKTIDGWFELKTFISNGPG